LYTEQNAINTDCANHQIKIVKKQGKEADCIRDSQVSSGFTYFTKIWILFRFYMAKLVSDCTNNLFFGARRVYIHFYFQFAIF